MIAKMARYRIKPEKENEVLAALGAFVPAIKENEPDTLRYVAYRLEDKVTFVHIMYFKNEQAEEFHHDMEHTRTFYKALKKLCDQAPEISAIEPVPAYIL